MLFKTKLKSIEATSKLNKSDTILSIIREIWNYISNEDLYAASLPTSLVR